MLDKSLIYKDIVMCLPFENLEDLQVPVLPDGYSYKMFESGDEIVWAELEVLVGEFDCFEDAVEDIMLLCQKNGGRVGC